MIKDDSTKGSASRNPEHEAPSRLRQPGEWPDPVDPRTMAQYTNVGAFPLFRRFPLADQTKLAVLAEMMSCPVAEAAAIVDSLSSEARACVADLLSEADVIESLPLLPFKHEARVLAAGDSITADRLGWAEMMSLLAMEVLEPRFTVVNMGVGGQTSADVISQMDVYADWDPDWVILMVGTNDFRFHTEQMTATMLSTSETKRNLLLIRQLIEKELGARLVVVTPPPIVDSSVVVGTGARAMGWRAEDIAAMAEFIRSEFADHVDVHTVLGEGIADDLFEDDGVHPSAQGQRLILRTILLRLPSIGS